MSERKQPLPDLSVLLLARYGMQGASSRVRHYAYIEPLRRRGIHVTAQHLIDDDSLANFYAGRQRRWGRIAAAYLARLARLAAARRFDAIWIEKEMLPGLPYGLKRGIFAARPTILDFDDFWIARHSASGADIGGGRELAKLRAAMTAATFVTAANSELADALFAATGRRAEVLVNRIDTETYRSAGARADEARKSAGRPPVVGWIGTPYTARLYLPSVASVLNRLSGEGLSRTLLIGAGDAVADIAAERRPWSLTNEARDVAAIDIGIQPLGASAFDQRKSGWKVYQYMAAGRPVVAHRAAFISDLIADGETGFIVDSEDEFEARLRQLVADASLRRRIGLAAQASIMSRFGLEGGADALAALFRKAVERHRQR